MEIPSIQFTGLASGIDTASLIDALVSVERLPIPRLQSRQSELQARNSTLGTFLSRLNSLESAADGLRKAADINATKATISDDSILSVSSNGNATPTVSSIEVQQLARVAKEVADGQADVNDTVIGSGTFTIDVGGTITNIDLTDATLGDIKDAINASDAEVSASIINDGTGTPYRLVITTDEGGDANTLSLSATGDQALIDFTNTFAPSQTAQDAILQIDNIEVRATSNVVDEAIEGVTLNLKKAEVGTQVDLNVTTDTDGIKANVNEFIDAYNDVVGFINVNTAFDESTGNAGSLIGDFTVSLVERRLQGIVSSALSGATGSFSALSEIGIRTGSDGTLSLDDTDFEEAVSSDIQGVLSIFAEDEGNLSGTVTDFLEEATLSNTGLVPGRQASIQRSLDDLQGRIESSEQFVDQFRENLVRRYASLERLISGLQSQGNFLSVI